MTESLIDPVLVLSALLVFLQAISISLLLTPLVRHVAHKRAWLDRPDGDRRIHAIPIPRIGGVAVYLSVTLALSLCAVFLAQTVEGNARFGESYLHLVIGSGAVMLIGLADDLKGVSPASKIFAQAAAALYLYAVGFRIELVTNPFGEVVALGWLSLPLTVLWLVGMSNAFNLIDGLDGLAAGVGFFATVSLFVAAVLNDRWDAAIVTAALGGALLGFLRFNFSPASIFLGDSGSLFVGFAMAALAIQSSMKASAAIAVAAPLFALALPILDVAIAVLRRFLTGRNIFEPDHDHIHHRLLRMGVTPRKAVIILYGVAALCASLSLVTMSGRKQAIGAGVIVSLLLTWAGIRKLGYAEFSELERILARRLLPDRRVLANNIHLIHLREALMRAETMADLWDALIESLSRLSIARVEMVLYREWAVLQAAALAVKRPVLSFPEWEATGSSRSARCSWSWNIVLGRDSSPMGTLLVTPGGPTGAIGFEPSYLIDAVTVDFADGLRRILPAGEAPAGTAKVEPSSKVRRKNRSSAASTA